MVRSRLLRKKQLPMAPAPVIDPCPRRLLSSCRFATLATARHMLTAKGESRSCIDVKKTAWLAYFWGSCCYANECVFHEPGSPQEHLKTPALLCLARCSMKRLPTGLAKQVRYGLVEDSPSQPRALLPGFCILLVSPRWACI